MSDHDVLKLLEGQAEAAVTKKLGEPDTDEHFLLDLGTTEFRIELLNVLPQSIPENVGIPVRELTWHGTANNTVWMVERDDVWVVVDTLNWDPNSDF